MFVRLTACDLRCSWCDTPYAFTEGRKMAVDDVVAQVVAVGCPLVEITGGEPLLQAGVYPEPAKFADNWRLEHRFKPNMSKATRERKLAGWARAVKGVLASDEGE